eukprot:scaffold17815_cov112-Isochrysis_galbana.AAC.3
MHLISSRSSPRGRAPRGTCQRPLSVRVSPDSADGGMAETPPPSARARLPPPTPPAAAVFSIKHPSPLASLDLASDSVEHVNHHQHGQLPPRTRAHALRPDPVEPVEARLGALQLGRVTVRVPPARRRAEDLRADSCVDVRQQDGAALREDFWAVAGVVNDRPRRRQLEHGLKHGRVQAQGLQDDEAQLGVVPVREGEVGRRHQRQRALLGRREGPNVHASQPALDQGDPECLWALKSRDHDGRNQLPDKLLFGDGARRPAVEVPDAQLAAPVGILKRRVARQRRAGHVHVIQQSHARLNLSGAQRAHAWAGELQVLRHGRQRPGGPHGRLERLARLVAQVQAEQAPVHHPDAEPIHHPRLTALAVGRLGRLGLEGLVHLGLGAHHDGVVGPHPLARRLVPQVLCEGGVEGGV